MGCVAATLDKIKEQNEHNNKMFVSSKYNGVFAIPAVEGVLEGLTQLVGGTAGSLIATASQQERILQQQLESQGIFNPGLSSILAGIAAITCLGTEAQLAYSYYIVQQMKKQVRLRTYYYNALMYHLGILYVELRRYQLYLLYFKNERIQQAKRRVDIARKAVARLNARLGGPRGIYDTYSNDVAVTNIAAAENILSGVQLNLKRSISQQFLDRLMTDVLGRQATFYNMLLWHSRKMAAYIPIPLIDLNKYTGLSAIAQGINTVTPGSTFDPVAAEFRWRVNPINTYEFRSFLEAINTIDLLKGLIPTNAVIAGYVDSVLNMEIRWTSLQTLSQQLLSMYSGIYEMLTEVSDDMGQVLLSDTTTSATYKIPQWVGELELARNSADSLRQTGQMQQTSMLGITAFENILAFLIEKEDLEAMNLEIPEYITVTLRDLATAPISRRHLAGAIVTVNETRRKIRKMLSYNYSLLHQLEAFRIDGNPVAAASAILIENTIKTFNSPNNGDPIIAGLGEALAGGGIMPIVSMLTALTSNSPANMFTAYSNIFSGCPSAALDGVMGKQVTNYGKNKETLYNIDGGGDPMENKT